MSENAPNQVLEDKIIEIVDLEGNKHYFIEERTIKYNEKYFAVLVSCTQEEEEPEVIIARIEIQNGEENYLAPTEEEYNGVMEIIANALM